MVICSLALTVIVFVTAYSPRVSETDASPRITACLTRPEAGTVAVSQDLFGRRGWGCGDPILVNGRRYIVNDTMSPRMRTTVDVFIESTQEALKHGIKRGVACPSFL